MEKKQNSPEGSKRKMNHHAQEKKMWLVANFSSETAKLQIEVKCHFPCAEINETVNSERLSNKSATDEEK